MEAWGKNGRKALVIGELHLYKENENSYSLFDRDPKLSDNLQLEELLFRTLQRVETQWSYAQSLKPRHLTTI